jgi:2-oxoisovalerate dehydrogenase E1 component
MLARMAGAATDARAALDRGFADHLRELTAISAQPPRGDGLRGALPRDEARDLFEAQLASRHLDFAARDLRARGAGFYTIGSAGHEGNAAVAAAARPTDPALLHYRSGGFFVRRAMQAGRREVAIRDVLLGMTAAADESIAGGRHKVFGSAELAIPPQTSTIASHLPKAVGLAFALDRGRRLGVDREAPDDAVVICSFGDASANHSTAAGAVNAACRIAVHLPVPVLFVCEDNGLGISVRTPADWIASAYGNRSGLRYLAADGCDPVAAYHAACAAVDHVRLERKPAFLHLSVVRFMGHAGSDVELVYRSPAEIEAELARDPLRRTAELLIRSGFATSEELIERYERVRAEVAAAADDAAVARRLSSADEVMAPLAPRRPELVAESATAVCDAATRAAFWGDRAPEAADRGLTLAGQINATLGDLLAQHAELLIFGEDVGRKGGVYGVTRGLDRRAGMGRVFDTILDEQTILGLAIGAGQAGFLPVPEIQYLAYLHNAIDQLRGEAATLSFFSRARYRNPMVIRIAGYAYQKGFGGHFHNDNAVASLRDIPGLVIASPSRGDDAAAMLRSCVAAAAVDGTVSVFLEPIALYNERDLYEPGDELLTAPYHPAPPHVPIGSARVHGDGTDLLIVSFANGLRMSLRAARRAAADHGIACRVLDLRWLAPLPVDDLVREAELTGRVVIADETRRSGGVSEAVIAALIDRGFTGPIRRVTSLDSFVPLGPAADHVLLTEAAILGTVITS